VARALVTRPGAQRQPSWQCLASSNPILWNVEQRPLLWSYLGWKRKRNLRLVNATRARRMAWPEFSGREILAAARSLSRCVLRDGCPVLSLHFCFALAPHLGQGVDKICPSESCSGFTAILFNMANLRAGQFCSVDFAKSHRNLHTGQVWLGRDEDAGFRAASHYQAGARTLECATPAQFGGQHPPQVQ
jgi:hypothetical protein